MVFIIYLCQGDMGICVICSAILIRFWFRLREQMPSITLNPRVLCGRRCTSPSLVLFRIIFDRFFAFKYLLRNFWFEFANQTTCSTLIWTSSKSKSSLKFSWWNTLQHSQLILQTTTFCWKVALVQNFIVAFGNQKQPSQVFCKKIVLKDFANFTGKTCVTAFKSTTLLKRDSNTSVFLWNLRVFKNIYFEKHLRATASGKYL